VRNRILPKVGFGLCLPPKEHTRSHHHLEKRRDISSAAREGTRPRALSKRSGYVVLDYYNWFGIFEFKMEDATIAAIGKNQTDQVLGGVATS